MAVITVPSATVIHNAQTPADALVSCNGSGNTYTIQAIGGQVVVEASNVNESGPFVTLATIEAGTHATWQGVWKYIRVSGAGQAYITRG